LLKSLNHLRLPLSLLQVTLNEERVLAYLDWVQWPAMVVTVLAAWLIGSQRRPRRMAGFVCFILSNVLWVIWGAYAHAYALIVLQICLFLMNLRGFKKNLRGA
jgi:hypothetical protein